MLNNLPSIDRVALDRYVVLRSPTPAGVVKVFIYGSDIETSSENMNVELEYKLNISTVTWTMLPSVQWVSQTSRWEAIFNTNGETYIGNYTFRARLGDAHGNWTEHLSSESQLKVLNNPPLATHTFLSKIYQANEDEMDRLDATNSSDPEDVIISKFNWDFGDGNTSSDAVVSHIFFEEGTYNVTLTVMDKDLESNITTIKINIINIPPTAVTTVDRIQAKVNEPIAFNGAGSYDTGSDTNSLKYLWEFDDDTTSQLATVSHSYNESGTYLVMFTVTDNNGDFDSNTIYITIEP